MNSLEHLARCFSQSNHARKESTRDFIIDYEKFLRSCDLHDGDAREVAERELAVASAGSGGLLRIDRHRRSGLPEKIRLAREGGEAWLFAQINAAPPTEQRTQLQQFFLEVSDHAVPAHFQDVWSAWARQLAEQALLGGSVQPFRRDDAVGNRQLEQALRGVLHWNTPALIRYASAAICGDSKQLQRLEPRLLTALAAITGEESLDAFGIMPKPRLVTFHGPLRWEWHGQWCDFSALHGPVSLAETNLSPHMQLTSSARVVLSVENEDTFHELAASNPGVLLVQTSYAGAAVRKFLRLLPQDLRFYHFGDRDAAGADILRDLREKSARDIQPLMVEEATGIARRALRQYDEETLKRLLSRDLPEALRRDVCDLLENGVPSDFEQESIAIPAVWQALRDAMAPLALTR
jgi:hypothetical protein